MKPKSIGILGGAGPLAGAYLFERLIVLSGKRYGCYRDADFPKVFLLSFPFTEMLYPEMDKTTLCKELSACLAQLRDNGASILAVACNTLHAFLDEKEPTSDLVHLPRAVAEEVAQIEPPLVLCTSTSMRFGLHKQFMSCVYPDEQTQQEIDAIIDQILKNRDSCDVLEKLERLIRAQAAKSIILGCTELSLYARYLNIANKEIIDPLEIAANQILTKSFAGRLS